MTEIQSPPTIDASALRILLIRLAECSFSVNPTFAAVENKEINLTFNFGVARRLVTPTRGIVHFQVSAFDDEPSPPFRVSVTYEGVFDAMEGHEGGLVEYMRVNALATLAPYVRETLSSISARAGFPPLILPPLNVISIAQQLDESAQSHASAETE